MAGCFKGGQESDYKELVRNFVERSGRNHLLLNVSKTNKTVVDFQRRKTATKINIMGEEVETVDSCR